MTTSVSYRAKFIDPEMLVKIMKLREEGFSYRNIARELKMSRNVVHEIFIPGFEARRISYFRTHHLTTVVDGQQIRIIVRKRDFPDHCELCRRNYIDSGRLSYHHWDPNHPELGMWVCIKCHHFAEGVERGSRVEDYLALKNKIINELRERDGYPEYIKEEMGET